MKVKDLVRELESIDGELELLFFSEDEEIVPDGYAYRILDIVKVSEEQVRTSRVENGTVTANFGVAPLSNTKACIELTSDI